MAIRPCQAPCSPPCPRPATGRSDLCRVHLEWQAEGRPIDVVAPPMRRRVERATTTRRGITIRNDAQRRERAIEAALETVRDPWCEVSAETAWRRACAIYCPKETGEVPPVVAEAANARCDRRDLLDQAASRRSGDYA